MKLFRKTWFALLLCMVLVFASTMLNTRIGFGQECASVTDLLYKGTDSIGVRLEGLHSELYGLLSLANANGLDTREAEAANEALGKALTSRTADAAALSRCCSRALETASSLISQLSSSVRDATGSERLAQFSETLADTRSALASSGYNERVRSFLKRNDRFPTNFMAELAGVSMPAFFG